MTTFKKKKGCLHSIWIGWIRLCRMINDFIESLFEKHTRFVTSHHKAVIIGSFIFVALMGIGGIWFNALQRNEELFIPQGSQAFTDLDKAEALFSGMKYRVQDIILMKSDRSNIINDNNIFEKACELYDEITRIANYKKACLDLKAPDGSAMCLVASTLQIFNFNKTVIQTANISTSLDSWLQDPQKLFYNGRPACLNFPNLLGNYRAKYTTGFCNYNNNTVVEFADAIRISYYMKYVNTDDDDYDMVYSWEETMIDLCKAREKDYKKLGLTLNYFAARTTDDAILESTIGDLPLFSVAFVLMVAFCLLVFSRWKNVVTGHLTVAIMGICVIMLGVGCGFGLAMWARTDFVAFTGILLFLILGIGMDNMFIIVDAMESVDPDIQGEERLIIALRHVGGSITMTTTTDLVAFAVSTVSSFPAVHLFCIYAALSIFFAYAMLLTLFIGLLTWDIHRMENGHRDICPCRKPIEMKGDVNPWLKEKEDFSKVVLRKWAEILMTLPMKIIVFLAACGLLAAGVYGTTKITQKFEWKKTSPDGSYFRKYADARDGRFPAGYGVSIILSLRSDEYKIKEIQDKVIDLDKVAVANSRYERSTINWMTSYRAWSKQKNLTITGDGFYENIEAFLKENALFQADLKLTNNYKNITAARVIFFYENDIDAVNQAEAMKTMRTDLKVENIGLSSVYPISIMFIYAEQFAAVLGDTLRNLIICGITIVVITIPYLMHPGITGLVFLSFTSLLFELLGLMTAWDVSLDVIAMIIIIMAVGFSVDYTCHIAHSYMISQQTTPERRVIDALTTMGSSVLNGGVSTFLGMLITAFSQAEGFRIFFKMVFGIVTLGLLHGLVFLPVLLSIFVRRDLREDMKEFIEKHDEEVRRKSKRRMSQMTEEQRKKQSISYRRQSVAHHAPNGVVSGISYIPEKIDEEPQTIKTDIRPTENGIEESKIPDINGNPEQTVISESGNGHLPSDESLEKGKVSGVENAGYNKDEIPVYYSVN